MQVNISQSCLPDKCSSMCELAISRLMALIEKIMDGRVTVEEIGSVMQKKLQVMKLCSAYQGCNLKEIQTALEYREAEHIAFGKRRNVLSSFWRKMDATKLKIEGL